MTPARKGSDEPRWLLLIHQIPPKPDYLRVKIGRRLQRVGAVPVKNSVYVLPARVQSVEDFQWIRTEILDGGGDASICRAEFVDGLTDDEVRQLFRAARDADYDELLASARTLRPAVRDQKGKSRRLPASRPDEELARLRKRFAAIAAIDFFDAPARVQTEGALNALAAGLHRPDSRPSASARVERARYRARTWVTRAGIYVDRIASAWLIRRFIDPDARFKFVDGADGADGDEYRRSKGEVRFDMFEAEFTHDGDRCTFETLHDRFGLAEQGLTEIGQIVHDIDLKDGKFSRDDALGVERVLAGIATAHADDAARLQHGSQLFDALFALFSSERSSRAGRQA